MNSSAQDSTNSQQRRQVASDVRFRPVFDEGVVIRQRAAEVLVLNQVGLRILELLSEEKTTTQVTDLLVSEFDVAREQLQADVGDFVAQLEAAGVVESIDHLPSDQGSVNQEPANVEPSES